MIKAAASLLVAFPGNAPVVEALAPALVEAGGGKGNREEATDAASDATLKAALKAALLSVLRACSPQHRTKPHLDGFAGEVARAARGAGGGEAVDAEERRLAKRSASGGAGGSSMAAATKRKAEEDEETAPAAAAAAAEDPRSTRAPKRSRWEEAGGQQQQQSTAPPLPPPAPQQQLHFDPRRGPPPPLPQLQPQQQQWQQRPPPPPPQQQQQQPPLVPPPQVSPPAAVSEALSVVCSLAARPGGAPQVEGYIRSLPPPLLADAALACLDRVSAPSPRQQRQQQQASGAFTQKFGALLELAAALRVPMTHFNPLLFGNAAGAAPLSMMMPPPPPPPPLPPLGGDPRRAAALPPPPLDPRMAAGLPPPPFDPRTAAAAAPPPPPFDPMTAALPPPPGCDPRFAASHPPPPPPPPPATDPRGFPMLKDETKSEPTTAAASAVTEAQQQAPFPVVAARPPPKPQSMDASARKKARRLAFERLLASTGISGIGVKSAAAKAKAGGGGRASSSSSSNAKLLHRSAAAAEFRAAALARLAALERPGEALGEALLASLKGGGDSDDGGGESEDDESEAAAAGGPPVPPPPPLATKVGLGLALRWLTSLFAAEAKRSSSSSSSSSLPAAPRGGRYETALRATLEALADAVVIETSAALLAGHGDRRKRRKKKKGEGDGGGDEDQEDNKVVVASVDPNKCVSRALLEAPSLQLLEEAGANSGGSSSSSSPSSSAVAVLLAPLLSRGGACANVALAAARDVALARPPARAQALGLVLDAATREAISVLGGGGGQGRGGNETGSSSSSSVRSFPVDDETRSKAVRLTANRLLPERALEAAILERARRELEAGMSLVAAAATDAAAAAPAAATTSTATTTTAADRHIELFCALTTRRPAALLPALLEAFAGSSKGSPGRAAALRRAPDLARTLGAAEPALLSAALERKRGTLPAGADALLLKMLYAATERRPPPRELAEALVAVGIGSDGEGEEGGPTSSDARYLPCTLAGLPKPEALALLPRLVWLEQAPLRAALSRLLAPVAAAAAVAGGGKTAATTRLVPAAELLEALTTVDGAAAAFAPPAQGEEEAGALTPAAAPAAASAAAAAAATPNQKTALARARKAVDAALALPGNAFGPAELAAALSRLMLRSPLPQLFFRVLLQAQAAAPSLRPFVVDVLGQTARRGGLWPAGAERGGAAGAAAATSAQTPAAAAAAWTGWLLAAKSAAPDSFPVLLSLPPRVLASALDPTGGFSAAASLRAPLTDYARSRSCPVAVGAETMSVLVESEAAAARARLAADMQD